VPITSGPFPTVSLPGLDGRPSLIAEAGLGTPALVLIGHRGCKTTRDTLPLVDRIHRRLTRGRVTAVLQDDAPDARALVDQLHLALPVQIEADPYPLAAALGLEVVPTIFALDENGVITGMSEGLRRADLEAFADRLGVPGALFGPEDAKIPPHKPG
jgi:hypothetical protein